MWVHVQVCWATLASWSTSAEVKTIPLSVYQEETDRCLGQQMPLQVVCGDSNRVCGQQSNESVVLVVRSLRTNKCGRCMKRCEWGQYRFYLHVLVITWLVCTDQVRHSVDTIQLRPSGVVVQVKSAGSGGFLALHTSQGKGVWRLQALCC
jgi:hypothetical protein